MLYRITASDNETFIRHELDYISCLRNQIKRNIFFKDLKCGDLILVDPREHIWTWLVVTKVEQI